MVVDSVKRIEMLAAALDLLDEGVVVLDPSSIVVYWNEAAAALTGHHSIDILSRRCPADLYEFSGAHHVQPQAIERYSGPAYSGQMYLQKSLADVMQPAADSGQAVPVTLRHHLGHTLPAMLRRVPLKDAVGGPLGTALLFRSVGELKAFTHGENLDETAFGHSQEEIEERLDEAFHEWKTEGIPFGLLWITVDQAAQMRRTHGRDACEAMLTSVEQHLTHGLRPTEVIGRWGNDDFLVLSHEPTAAMLLEHASDLAELARTANFRWWGDQVHLTASIGVAQAAEGDTLARLMLLAQQAMHAGVFAGGNRVTDGREQTCLQ